MTRAPHYAESVSIAAGARPGEVILEFTRNDGRITQGADRLIVKGVDLERLVEGLPLVASGAVGKISAKPLEEK